MVSPPPHPAPDAIIDEATPPAGTVMRAPVGTAEPSLEEPADSSNLSRTRKTFITVAILFTDLLTPALGRHTAMRALKLAATRIGTDVATLGPEHVDGLRKELHPMLRTLLGAALSEQLLDAAVARCPVKGSTPR